MSYSTARASGTSRGRTLWGGENSSHPVRRPDVSVLAGRGHRSPRGDVTLKARFSFQEARSAWGNCDWIAPVVWPSMV